MRRIPAISRPCRGVSRALVFGLARLLRLVRERDDAARRAPLAERELRVVVRRILQASGRRHSTSLLGGEDRPRVGVARWGPRSLITTSQVVRRAILSMWLSIHSPKPSCGIETSSRSAGLEAFTRGRSASRCATWQSWTARDGAGCSAPKTASGTAESASGGCKPILLGVSSVRHAVTTTSGATASASNAVSGSTANKTSANCFRARLGRRDQKPDADDETPEQHDVKRNRQPLVR